MVDLGPAYATWRRTPFPIGSGSDEVEELHADLAMWDAFVAEAVIPMEGGRRYDPGVHDQAAAVEDLRRRIEVGIEGRKVKTGRSCGSTASTATFFWK